MGCLLNNSLRPQRVTVFLSSVLRDTLGHREGAFRSRESLVRERVDTHVSMEASPAYRPGSGDWKRSS